MARHLPPTIHALLEVPEYTRMMKTQPWLPESLRWGNPWRLWALRETGVWVTKEYATYGDAWRMAVKVIRNDDYADVSIVNKRLLTAPLKSLSRALEVAGMARYPWCPRCRRPTYFGAFTEKHHALRLQPALTTDEPFRCYYCGIRKEMARTA